jgi:cytochrome b561
MPFDARGFLGLDTTPVVVPADCMTMQSDGVVVELVLSMDNAAFRADVPRLTVRADDGRKGEGSDHALRKGDSPLHVGVAVASIWKLGVSLVMRGPRGTTPGDVLFTMHSYVGLAALGLILMFWLDLIVRRIGTDAAALFPWFSSVRRAALWCDANAQFGSLIRLRLSDYVEDSALASAVLGLGLLLMTLLAGIGAAWWALVPAATAGPFDAIHKAFANLAWVYLIAHASLAVLHHVRGEAPHMWLLRDRT